MDMSYSFLYPYVSTYIDPANIDTFFLFFNTTAKQNIGLAAFAALLMYANMQLMQVVKPTTLPTLPGQEKQPDMAQMMGSMNIILVVMIGGFVYSAPAGIGLYIVTSTLVGVVQMARQNRLLLQAKRASRNSSNIIIGK